jgi:hypothetical protein
MQAEKKSVIRRKIQYKNRNIKMEVAMKFCLHTSSIIKAFIGQVFRKSNAARNQYLEVERLSPRKADYVCDVFKHMPYLLSTYSSLIVLTTNWVNGEEYALRREGEVVCAIEVFGRPLKRGILRERAAKMLLRGRRAKADNRPTQDRQIR